MRFRSFFGPKYIKNTNFKTIILEALFSLYYYKQHIAYGFWIVNVSLMDRKYSTKKA